MTALRIVTWNLQGSKGVDVSVIGGLLRAMTAGGDIQVVALQEVQRRQARALALAWGAKDWRWARKHLPYGPLVWWRAEGLAVLAIRDLDAHDVTPLTPGVRSWSYRRRILQFVRVDHPTVPVMVFNTHLASHDDPAVRADQAVIVAEAITAIRRSDRTVAEVLTGDLNAPDEPATLAAFRAIDLHDAWPSTGGDPGFTNPSGAPYQRLDYVLVSASIVITSADVALGVATWPMLSDHLPLRIAATIEPGSNATPES